MVMRRSSVTPGTGRVLARGERRDRRHEVVSHDAHACQKAPLCLKKVKRLSSEDAQKAKAAEHMAKWTQKEADKGEAPGGAAGL